MTTSHTVPPAAPRLRSLHPFVLSVAFLSTFYVALLGPVLPALVEPLGGNAFTIGLLFACYALAQFLTAPALGAVADRFGRRATLLISMCGVVLGLAVFIVGAVTEVGLWPLFLGLMIVGASDCWLSMAFSYVADTTEPEGRTRYFAFLTAAIGSAFVIGPAVTAVFSGGGPTTPLLVLLALVVGATMLGRFQMPESLPPAQRETSLPVRKLNPGSQIHDILQFPQLRLLLLSYLLLWPGVIILSSNLPTMLAERADFGPGRISTILLIYGSLVVIVQLGVIPLLLRRVSEIPVAVTGAVFSGVAFVLLALYPATGALSLVYTGVVAFGLGQPLWQTCLTGSMSRSMDADMQGRVAGSIAATMALAQVVGPFAAGWLYESVSPSAPYWTVTVQVTVAVVLMLVAAPRIARLMERRRSEASSTAG